MGEVPSHDCNKAGHDIRPMTHSYVLFCMRAELEYIEPVS